MIVRIKEKIDHLSVDEEYEVVMPYSPHEKYDNGYIAASSSESTLLIMPKSSINGHFADANIRSWWVPNIYLEIIEQDYSIARLKLDQRWRWKYNTDDWIVEIVKLIPNEKYAVCKIVQMISGDRQVYDQLKWNFGSKYWEYLEGQDRP